MRRLVGVAVLALVTLVGCKEAKGGFGEAKPENPGVRVKPQAAPRDDDKVPDFKGALKVTPRFDTAQKTLTVQLAIQPGFHAYAPGEEIGKPVTLSVDPSSGWALDGDVVIPAGKEKDLGELGKSLILEGTVSIRAKVKGAGAKVAGSVTVQICTDNACDRPRQHAFELPAS